MAKTDRESDLTLNLPDHLEDAENTARLLWRDFVPDAVRRVISDDLGGTEPALAFVCFLAGTHDVGKASSAFAQKLPPTATSRSSSLGLKIHAVRAPAPHGAIGQIAAREWLESAVGKGPGAYDLAEIIGGHHGRYPKREDLRLIKDDLATWETPGWSPIRAEVLATMAAATGADAYLAGWVASGIPMRTKILVEAIVIMADWIASGSDLFPYADDRASSERAMDALEALSFPPPWNPSATQRVELEELFRDRFPHLACGDPNDLQRVVTELARAARTAPLMIIEAPMGAGKTEAGLLGGEILAARFGQGGLYFGLPTMATANPVFAKVSSWLSTMKGPATSIQLAHGKAALNEDFARMTSASRIRGMMSEASRADSDEEHVRVVEWLRGRKRTLLANHVVGTIDQVLMAGLKAKHVVLRLFGLAGKVVIIDEVHAADTFMREYLLAVLEWLGRFGTPVILMSATLPPAQRQAYVHAYASGRGDRPPELSPEIIYPQITMYDGSVTTSAVPTSPESARSIIIETRADDMDELMDLLRGSLADGGCAAVIRNTVTRAQVTFERVREEFGDEAVLLHSRFIAPHRLNRERKLVKELGPTGNRPYRRIVVGTQVLEQSLDVDFDLMITPGSDSSRPRTARSRSWAGSDTGRPRHEPWPPVPGRWRT